MMELKPIQVEEVTIEELEFLAKSTDLDFDETRPADLCQLAMMGKSLIWRFTGDNGESGVLVTRANRLKGGLELFIQHMGGVGLLKNAQFIFETLEEFGREHGFRWMTGNATKPLARIYTRRLGFKETTVQVVKEIQNG